MYEIMKLGGITDSKVESYQKATYLSFIGNQYFVWTCLVVFLNSKNWKRPVMLILIFHWFLRCVGDVFLNSFDFFEKKYESNWPFSNDGWLYSFGVASIFWYCSEILGDWYILMRTKAIIRNSRKIRIVYFTCILYNILKLAQMYIYLWYVPFQKIPGTENMSKEQYEKAFADKYNSDMGKFKTLQWANVSLQLVVSSVYDIAVIRLLRKCLFDKLKDNNNMNLNDNESKFLSRFKFISEYRIVISLIATILVFPLVISVAIFIYYRYLKKLESIDDTKADGIRQCVLSINYTLMYIDQILLRFFVEENNSKKSSKASSNPNSIHSMKSFNSQSEYYLISNNNKNISNQYSSPTSPYGNIIFQYNNMSHNNYSGSTNPSVKEMHIANIYDMNDKNNFHFNKF